MISENKEKKKREQQEYSEPPKRKREHTGQRKVTFEVKASIYIDC